jgi:8-oxo-dGTP diphosphatase
MAREPVQAAGGIVLRRERPPLIAVVRMRRRDEWVLPKGKLDDGETPRAAAKREVLEETGHNVTVHEFLGTLVVETGGGSKVVHYWRMEARGGQTRALMNDIRAVDWLPLDAALERLSRGYERAFLANVGPQALASLVRKTRVKAQPARKRRGRPAPEPMPALADSGHIEQPFEEAAAPLAVVAAATEPAPFDATALETASAVDDRSAEAAESRRSLAQKLRDWLGRAA